MTTVSETLENTTRGTFFVIAMGVGALMFVTMGARQVTGLFVSDISRLTSTTITQLSFAAAIAQICWGAVQPLAAIATARWGSRCVLVGGMLLLALGWGLLPVSIGGPQLYATLGIMTGAGAGIGSFAVLTAASSGLLPAYQAERIAIYMNLGGAAGQFLVPPIIQACISHFGWAVSAGLLALVGLASIVVVVAMTEGRPRSTFVATNVPSAWRADIWDPSFILIQLGFMTCGFHIAFLMTHLPGEITICGLGGSVASVALSIIGIMNIVGIVITTKLGRVFPHRTVLFSIYAARCVIIILYITSPSSSTGSYLFATALGMTWFATVPPILGMIKSRFGAERLPALFGFALFTHQLGGFLGAWLGGIVVARFGNYAWIWYIDIILAVCAALLCIPINDAPRLSNRHEGIAA
jgi:predicted MFS family arabinose efflux permease